MAEPPQASHDAGADRDRALWAALFSISFHAIRASADPRAQRWAALIPDDIDERLVPMSLDDAHRTLSSEVDKDGRIDGDRARAYAAAILGWAAYSPLDEQADGLEEALEGLCDGGTDVLKKVKSAGHGAEAALLALLKHLRIAECVESFTWEGIYDIDLESTEVTVQVDVDRPASEFKTIVDPQNWWIMAPGAFLASFRMEEKKVPDEVTDTPNEQPVPTGESWDWYLFEHAQLAITPTSFSAFRNVLNIKYDVVGDTISLDYRLVENLTQRVLVYPSINGIDMDGGKVSVEPVSPTKSKLKATKNFRFNRPPMLKSILNLMNLPFLVMWMLFHVVGGACAPAPAAAP